jgi:hypothetical protein
VLSLYVRTTDVSFLPNFLSLLQSLGLFSSCEFMVCLPSYVIVIFTTSLLLTINCIVQLEVIVLTPRVLKPEGMARHEVSENSFQVNLVITI